MADGTDIGTAQQGATPRHNFLTRTLVSAGNVRPDKALSERQQNAIELLLRGLSDQAVGTQLGVDRGTVYRWRRGPEFQQELNRQRQALWEQSATAIQSMISPALAILREQLTSTDADTAIRAASVLLRFATPSRLTPLKLDDSSQLVKEEMLRMGEALIEYVDQRLPNRTTRT